MIRTDTQRAAVAPAHVAALQIRAVNLSGFHVDAHMVGGAVVTLSEHATKEGAQRRLELWVAELSAGNMTEEGA